MGQKTMPNKGSRRVKSRAPEKKPDRNTLLAQEYLTDFDKKVTWASDHKRHLVEITKKLSSNNPDFSDAAMKVIEELRYGVNAAYWQLTKKISSPAVKGAFCRAAQPLINKAYDQITHSIVELIQEHDDAFSHRNKKSAIPVLVTSEPVIGKPIIIELKTPKPIDIDLINLEPVIGKPIIIELEAPKPIDIDLINLEPVLGNPIIIELKTPKPIDIDLINPEPVLGNPIVIELKTSNPIDINIINLEPVIGNPIIIELEAPKPTDIELINLEPVIGNPIVIELDIPKPTDIKLINSQGLVVVKSEIPKPFDIILMDSDGLVATLLISTGDRKFIYDSKINYKSLKSEFKQTYQNLHWKWLIPPPLLEIGIDLSRFSKCVNHRLKY